ncbi:MAG: tyrosine-type recombinase/integrase [Anaerolineae bacterium]|nr:tyrosine-type recombinase/integrase [Anaerolineae bacterium]
MAMESLTVQDALEHYLAEVAQSRSPLTHKSYRQAVRRFAAMLQERRLPPASTPAAQIAVEWMAWFVESLRDYAVATEQLYLTALSGFYEQVAAENWAEVNLPALKRLRQRRTRREATRLPPFPRDEIAQTLSAVAQAALVPRDELQERLQVLRDCAFLFTLADTGLRVAEACSIIRGHLDWNESHAIVLGKGGREAVVRFSPRSLRYLRAYLEARAELDGTQGRRLDSLPLFARHDRAAGKRVLPISTRSAEKIVEKWVMHALGRSARGSITPHTFRHYFVTVVLRGSGGNIRLAQELARHRSIVTTQRYTHLSDDELDHGYHEIFGRAGTRTNNDET